METPQQYRERDWELEREVVVLGLICAAGLMALLGFYLVFGR